MLYASRCFYITFWILILSVVQVCVARELSVSVQNNIRILKDTGNCPQCDLSGADLSRLDLAGANLAGADLSRSKLALTNLSDSNLQGANLRETNFSGADLANTDLRGANLTATVFVGAYMVGALMDGEMIRVFPYSKDKISDVEESVYVEDTEISKQPQETKDINVGTRREFEQNTSLVPVTNAGEERGGQKLPDHNPSAPNAKNAPAMDQVRIQNDTRAVENFPEFSGSKKEPSLAKKGKNISEKSTQSDPLSIRTIDNEEKQGRKSGSEGSINNLKEMKGEVDNSPVESLGFANKKTNSEARKDPVAQLNESGAVIEVTEEEKVPVKEETDGIVASVLNLFSSPELSTDVLKNAARLLDTNGCYQCDLQGVNLKGENLDGADLEGANLSYSLLQNVDLEGANLRQANLEGADLSGVDFSEADLYKADLSGANLTNAKFERAKIDAANFTNTIGYHNQSVLMLENQ